MANYQVVSVASVWGTPPSVKNKEMDTIVTENETGGERTVCRCSHEQGQRIAKALELLDFYEVVWNGFKRGDEKAVLDGMEGIRKS